VINDAPVHAATTVHRRHTVVLHRWNAPPVQPEDRLTPDHADTAPPPPSRWHSLLDYAEVVVASVSAVAVVAYDSPGSFTMCVAIGMTHLITRYDWRALLRRLREGWRTWRKPGRHRANRRGARFCPT
jgi:hypothetical protein